MFGIFGRSQEMQSFDRALRGAGLVPRGVPEAVKLTTLKQLKESNFGRSPDAAPMASAAELIGYCLLGADEFLQLNGAARRETAEARITAALHTGYGLDARLILLTMRAGVIHPAVVEHYGLTWE